MSVRARGLLPRLASLLRASSLPGAPEERRAFMQQRVAIYFGANTLVWAVGAFGIIVLALLSRSDDVFAGESGVFMGLVMLIPLSWGALWLGARRGQPSLRRLALADLGGALLLGLVFGALAAASLPLVHLRPDVQMILLLGAGLTVRAGVVPSNAARTALVGVVASVPVCVGTWLVYHRAFAQPVLDPIFNRPGSTAPALFVVWAALFCAFPTVVTAIVSAVIYGLQRQVSHARRLGQYTLEAKIGSGGMGTVYRARHALLRRPTAIKLLAGDRGGAEQVARFEREVQITSQLSHPNTVAIYDYGRTPDDQFYYAMEYLDGVDLETLVRKDGPQSPARVCHLLRQVLGALSEAHARGLIHRDIKPANVMLCERGLIPDFVKLLDFGLVRELDMTKDGTLTQAGALTGTPLYMSPEQIRGEPLDARSDVYAVGALGYHLLAGRSVFTALTPVEVWAHHLHTEPERPSRHVGHPLPAALEDLLMSCLHKDPAARPADALALLARLEACPPAPVWTDQDARHWWRERGDGIRAAAIDQQCDPGGATVAISIADRGS